MLRVGVLVLSLTLSFQNADSLLLLNLINVLEGGSFMQYITEPVINITSCTATFNMTTISLDVHSSNIILPTDYRDVAGLSKRISSLGRGMCGFRLVNATKDDPEYWDLQAIDANNRYYNGTFRVALFAASSNTHTVKEVVLGLSTSINCGIQSSQQSQDFCKLYNPLGNLVLSSDRCNLGIDVVSFADIGIWRCAAGVPQKMETIIYTVELVQSDKLAVEGWVEEKDDYISIGCKIKNFENLYVRPEQYCQMVSPIGEVYLIREGKATPKYTTVETNLSNFVCGIEIETPIKANEEGVWRCKIRDRGTIITVGRTAKSFRNFPRQIELYTMLRQQFIILCEVPYSALFCHIIAPNGTTYNQKYPSRAGYGECSLEIAVSVPSDNGTWTCSFTTENSMTDDTMEVQVIIANVLIYKKEVGSTIGGVSELLCRTGGLPLEYCRFISPSTVTYNLLNHHNSSKIGYSGRGLEYGDCGIKLYDTDDIDFGNWTCVLSIHKEELTARTLLFRTDASIFSDTNLATSIGLSVGAALLIIIVIGMFLYKRWKARRTFNGTDEPMIGYRTSEQRINIPFAHYSTTSTENVNVLSSTSSLFASSSVDTAPRRRVSPRRRISPRLSPRTRNRRS